MSGVTRQKPGKAIPFAGKLLCDNPSMMPRTGVAGDFSDVGQFPMLGKVKIRFSDGRNDRKTGESVMKTGAMILKNLGQPRMALIFESFSMDSSHKAVSVSGPANTKIFTSLHAFK